MKKLTTRDIRHGKGKNLQMLTCYDYQTARMLNETDVDMILVGDSLGNVVLGFETTVSVTPMHMEIFASAVKRGAPDKFTICDLPFGAVTTLDRALAIATKLFQRTGAEAVKLEGAGKLELKVIERLTHVGVPVMGHIGLTPQSVHQMGGYYIHGKDEQRAQELIAEAKRLQDAGCFAIVLECVEEKLASNITEALHIPTIGIGSGADTDGQVLVINDLLKMGPDRPPKFCTPVADLYATRKNLIEQYLKDNREHAYPHA